MESDYQKSREQLINELDELRERLKQCSLAIEELKRKDEFNVALFEYNPALTVVVDRNCRVIRLNKARQSYGDRLPRIGDIMYRDYATAHSIDMYAILQECILTQKSRFFPELDYRGKVLSVTISPFPDGAIIVSQDITDAKKAERDRMRLIEELRRALAQVESLQGLLPVCSLCKRIRGQDDTWYPFEEYIASHSRADFSHTICPLCTKAYYPEMWEKSLKKGITSLPQERSSPSSSSPGESPQHPL